MIEAIRPWNVHISLTDSVKRRQQWGGEKDWSFLVDIQTRLFGDQRRGDI